MLSIRQMVLFMGGLLLLDIVANAANAEGSPRSQVVQAKFDSTDAVVAPAPGRPSPIPWKPGDIIAGYFQNKLAFESISVTWSRKSGHQSGFFQQFNSLIDSLRTEKREASSEEGRSEIQAQIEYYKELRDHPANKGVRIQQYGFSSNGRSFLLRLGSPTSTLNDTFQLSDLAIPAAEEIPKAYGENRVLTFNPGSVPPFRLWTGSIGDSLYGTIESATFPKMPMAELPPLAEPPGPFDAPPHPIDTFFSRSIDRYQVERVIRQKDGSIRIVIVYLGDPLPPRAYLLPEQVSEWKERLTLRMVERAYVDPERGFLPRRIEWAYQYTLDGKDVKFHVPSSGQAFRQVLDVTRIDCPVDDAWYPKSGVVRQYEPARDFEGPVPSPLERVLAGTSNPVPMLLVEEDRWIVADLSLEPLPSYQLNLPKGTRVLDLSQSKRVFVGDAAEIVRGVAGQIPNSHPTFFNWDTLLLSSIILFVILFVTIVARRSRIRTE